MEQRAWRPATDDELVLNAVVITADDSFYAKLRRLGDEHRWCLVRAQSIEEAEVLIGRGPTPLVVYEGDAGNGNWRFALRRLNALPPHPCVLLASAVADENLLREVLRNNGYDVLPKAASGEKLAQCLSFAWFWALSHGAADGVGGSSSSQRPCSRTHARAFRRLHERVQEFPDRSSPPRPNQARPAAL